MFTEEAKNSIMNAIKAETEAACKIYGPKYASEHEAYAVLKEEVEESQDEMERIQRKMEYLWLGRIRQQESKIFIASETKEIQHTARKLALEACQVAAVCQKFLVTIGEDK